MPEPEKLNPHLNSYFSRQEAPASDSNPFQTNMSLFFSEEQFAAQFWKDNHEVMEY